VDVLSQDFFNKFAMSSLLFSELWTFFVTRFSDICDVLPPAQQTVDVLSHHLWKNTDGAVRRKKQQKSHDTVP
jgi:hypothetical protein